MNADKLVVGLAGMPGSGKSLVVEAARELGYAVVVMGDVIREETVKRGLELTPQNVGRVMLQLRAESGNAVVVMGDVVREETTNRGLELTPQNVGAVMLQLRAERGNTVVAMKCVPKIEEQASSKVLVDGLRSLYEIDAFKEHFAKFAVVAVHASPETRFNRLFSRRRSDDPHGWEVFQERDIRELGVGLGNVIAMAEQLIVNDNSVEDVKVAIKEALGRIEAKWAK